MILVDHVSLLILGKYQALSLKWIDHVRTINEIGLATMALPTCCKPSLPMPTSPALHTQREAKFPQRRQLVL
eukprot:4347049-Amphidinium_carterae.1